ncbi:alpha/beta fold hydrolase [Pyruvatibacter sp.]|uniref:alpha/beta hydrolase n=1 Tax=Pyruvatibacter sp. TaxID=1981328 RepID=UPI003265E586
MDAGAQPVDMTSKFNRKTVEFLSHGVKIEAYLYTPSSSDASTPLPAVVTAPGFGGVKEMLIESYADYLTAAGIACLSLDYRHFGGSDGMPRQHIDPVRQVEDMQAGIDYLETADEIDSARIGVWGTSMSGGHTITVAAIDSRIKAAVAIIPFLTAGKPSGDIRAIRRAALLDTAKRLVGMRPGTIPIFAESPGEFAVMASDGGWEWMQNVVKDAPNYRNEVTLQSLFRLGGYLPERHAGQLSVPTMLMAAKADSITPAEPIEAFAQKVSCATEYIEYPESHFELFGEHLAGTADQMVRWFKTHL